MILNGYYRNILINKTVFERGANSPLLNPKISTGQLRTNRFSGNILRCRRSYALYALRIGRQIESNF